AGARRPPGRAPTRPADRRRDPGGWRGCQRLNSCEQSFHAGVDVVPDPADLIHCPARRVLDLPVLIALARIDRARVATPHGYDHVCRPDEPVGEGLGELLRHVDAQLVHHLHHGGGDLLGGDAARRPDAEPALRVHREQSGGHLAPTGIVNADEEDLLHLLCQGTGRTARACCADARPYQIFSSTRSEPTADTSWKWPEALARLKT